MASAPDSEGKLCILIMRRGRMDVRACSDSCVADWSCHQPVVEMTVDFCAAAT